MKKDDEICLNSYATYTDFRAHFENGQLVVDRCEGIELGAALSLFPGWALAELAEDSLKR